MQMRLLFGFLFILSGLTLKAQTLRGLTPMDIASLKSVASATWSADGGTIAYTQRVQSDPTVENKPSRAELFVYHFSSDSTSSFVSTGNVRMVSFRPGHNTITFLNKLENDKVTSLYEIPVTGGEATLLFAFEKSISSYQWSPDGETLGFIATVPDNKPKSALPYSPELYEQNLAVQHIYLVRPGIGQQVREIETPGHFTAFEWSPTGDRLLCAYAPTSLVDDSYMAMHLMIINVEPMKILGQIDHSAKLGDFQWSPDGTQIAFIAGSDINDPTDGSLFVVPATGGKPTMLLNGWQGMFEHLIWQDAGQIHFVGSTGVEAVYGTVKPDAKAKPSFSAVEKGFNITHFELTTNGSALFIADRYNHPSEVFIETPGNATPKQLTKSNPLLADIEFAKQEVIRYKAKDGLEIEGILIRPLHEENGKKYPLITIVHGGPEAHFNNGWLTAYSNPGQTGAAEEYAVFYPNYRGSTGRGVEFTLSSQGDPAGKEFDDVVDGVDYLIASGLVDGAKVGVTGGSYGGYATGWLSTRYSDRFAAGVMFVGISNNISKWGTTDIPNEEYLVHARKWVYEDYDFFLKRSPIYYADQCKTPLLIMHGKDDPRVHPGQSMELYRHIKSRTETPVELVFYPGEGHGNANSTARYDYNLRLMAWFDKYLKGVGKS